MLKSHLLGEIMRCDKIHELQHISVTRKFIRLLVKHNNFGLILKEKRSGVRLSTSPLLEPVLVSLYPMTHHFLSLSPRLEPETRSHSHETTTSGPGFKKPSQLYSD